MQFSKAILTSLLFSVAYAQLAAPTSGTPETVTGALGDAKPELDNPTGKAYIADFSKTPLRGSIKFQSSYQQNQPVQVTVELSGFPPNGAPFAYHIHAFPVPPNGNCSGTLSHLDPYIRGQNITCDPKRPQSCEVGDLSGKYGKVPETIGNGTFTASYTDQYITLQEGKGSFIGNRSVVIHLADPSRTRYACVNITEWIKTAVGPTVTPQPSSDAGYRAGGVASYWGYAVVVATGLRYLLV